jgi:acetylornithine deacetylase/succinyl-diaminopimelate desuccinylase family protein
MQEPPDDPVDLLSRLIAIPSVNPDDCDDAALAGEARLADFLDPLLRARGFSVSRHDTRPGRPNLIAAYGPAAPRRTLLLEVHLDTVGVRGMTIPPFTPEIREGRLYGRGACDMKGAMAAALCALRPDTLARLARAGWRVLFVGAMGEESGNLGIEDLVGRGLVAADMAIVLEPTGLAPVVAHKGALWVELGVAGVAAHGSVPERGLSAVRGMMFALALLEEDVRRLAEWTPHPLLGRPTLNIGRIRGGSAVNVVPDHCLVELDRRTLPSENHDQLLSQFLCLGDRLRADGVARDFSLRVLKDSRPFTAPADSELVGRLAACCREAGGVGEAQGTSWFSDAGPLAAACREVAVFGPGRIEQAHTEAEYIELEQLRAGTDILGRFLRGLAESL